MRLTSLSVLSRKTRSEISPSVRTSTYVEMYCILHETPEQLPNRVCNSSDWIAILRATWIHPGYQLARLSLDIRDITRSFHFVHVCRWMNRTKAVGILLSAKKLKYGNQRKDVLK
jgi:hypothetical protein